VGGIRIEAIHVLERLVSIKSNAQARAMLEAKKRDGYQHEMKAFILENGIEQLIIEIQNSILADYRTDKRIVFYKRSISSQAS
jgi:hypothetical protein